MKNPFARASVFVFLFFAFVIHHSSFCFSSDPASPGGYAAAGWPQLQHDAQRTGRASDTSMRMPERPEQPGHRWREFVVGWTQDFELFDPPQHISRVTQIIAYGNKLYIPTMEGRLYALDPADGSVLWFFDCGEGVMHTAGAADGRVFFAGINGGVFAVDSETGKELWRWRPEQRDGFSAAVLLAEDKIFIGSRAGRMRAVSQSDGKLLWEQETVGPIFQSAAYNEGRVYAAAEDMHAYCWAAADGKQLWKSEKLNGMSFRDYYPLVYKGKVFFESQNAWSDMNCVVPGYNGRDGWFPLAGIFEYAKEFEAWLPRHGEAMAEGKPDEEALRDIYNAQQEQMTLFEEFPRENLRHVLDEETGRESMRLPLIIIQSMCGNQPPPSLDRDGMLIMPVAFFNNRYARFDFDRNQFVDLLMGIGQWQTGGDQTSMARGGNHDEVNNVSTSGPLIFNVHSLEHGGISGQGVYCLDSRRWGLLEAPDSHRAPNVQCGGNAASIAYGAAYHHVYGQVHNWIPNTGK